MPEIIRYILKRILLGIITLSIFLSLVFFAVQLMLPGDYVTQYALQLGPEQRELIQEELGLDKPVHLRFFNWFNGLLHLDLGNSFGGEPVNQILRNRFPFTALLLICSLAIAFFTGFISGKWAGWQKRKWISDSIIVISLVFYASFPPFVAFLTSYILIPKIRGWIFIYPRSILRWLTTLELSIPGLYRTIDPHIISHDVSLLVNVIVVFSILFIFLNIPRFKRTLQKVNLLQILTAAMVILFGIIAFNDIGVLTKQLIQVTAIPVITVVLMISGDILLNTITSLKSVLNEPYILSAKAKGLSVRLVRDKHAAKNAVLSVITRFGVLIPFMFSGIAIVEVIFGWPGIGSALWGAILNQDVPLFMGALLLLGLLTLLLQIMLDLVSLYLDPRLLDQAFQITPVEILPTPFILQIKSRQRPRLQVLVDQIKRLRQTWSNNMRRLKNNWKVYIEDPKAVIGLAIFILLVVMAISHPILLETIWSRGIYDPHTGVDYRITNPAPPTWTHPLGTTTTGLDILSLLLVSTRNSFTLGITAGMVAAALGVILGLISAYLRGNYQLAINQVTNAFLLLPAPIFMAFAGMALRDLGPGKLGMIYGLIAGLGPVAMIMREYAAQFVVKPYIEAAKISGSGTLRLITRHLIPQMIPMALIQMLVTATGAVIVDGYLSWLGVTRYYVNWGTMLFYSQILSEYLVGSTLWRAVLPPVICFSLFGLSFHLISNGIHRVVDPLLRNDI
jgi:peptide/nickel transport system permease protein